MASSYTDSYGVAFSNTASGNEDYLRAFQRMQQMQNKCWSTTMQSPGADLNYNPDPEIANKDCIKIERRKTMLENVKGYVEKHKDMLFTLGLVILVDHFLFKGALRERIKATVEGALKKVENTFHKEE